MTLRDTDLSGAGSDACRVNGRKAAAGRPDAAPPPPAVRPPNPWPRSDRLPSAPPGNGDAVTQQFAPPGSTAAPPRPQGGGDSLTELQEALRGLPPRGSLTVGEAFKLAALALLLVLVGGGAGLAVSTLVPTEYAARAELLYPLSVEQPTGFLREDRNLTTQLLLIENRAALVEVGAAHGLTPEQLGERLSVEVVDSSEIIRVEVRDGSREKGVAIVDAVVSRYLAYAQGQRADPVRDYVQSQLDETRRQLGQARDDVVLLDRERALVAQLDGITTDELSRPRPSILAPAYSVPNPVNVGPALTTSAGALVGLLVAAPVVLWLARRRTRR